ncbi:hypothetical protein AAFF_G00100910 [Aldrovandia affinis]|uniref:Secreted protein n=1 Tax=Aldrovandia affinis TaxID=143900 RepID=A0AAD7RXB5_9TELE|nr:hypothetical protein AAFF_G00100910 [Aldrovandia affinis]
MSFSLPVIIILPAVVTAEGDGGPLRCTVDTGCFVGTPDRAEMGGYLEQSGRGKDMGWRGCASWEPWRRQERFNHLPHGIRLGECAEHQERF